MAFGAFEVHGGDFKVGGTHQLLGDELLMEASEKKGIGRRAHVVHAIISLATMGVWMVVWVVHCWVAAARREKIPLEAVTDVEIATEESSRRWGLGAAGLVLLGPLGLLGALATRKKITFLATLKDGRKFLATGKRAVYRQILGATI